MIEVDIKLDGKTIGNIKIIRQPSPERGNQFGDYEVRYVIERGEATGLHKRFILHFPRKQYNVFALLLQALNTLNEKDLKLERDFDPDKAPVSTDVARRLGRTVQAIQRRKR